MRRARVIVGSFAAVLAAVALAGHLRQSLYIDGKMVSGDIRVIEGRSYVPVGDVAKALGYQISRREDGLSLDRAGGANQVGNSNTGKQGQEIFTGKWRLLVSNVERVKSYDFVDNNFVPSSERHMAASETEDLIVVTCRIKNGTPARDELVFSGTWDGMHNALTDENENSYIPAGFDLKPTEDSPVGAMFNPGAAINFKVIFRVPTSAHPKDFIFTAMSYSARSQFDMKGHPPTDIRVSLRE